MKIKLHPLFLVLVAVTAIFGDGISMLWSFLAVLFHECGHILVARTRGYLMKNLVIMPYGAEMSPKDNFDNVTSVLVGFAGPLTNIFLALVTLGVWWIFPSLYQFTKPFFDANLSLAFFNLLPVYPLDGSRVMVGVMKNKLKALRILRVFGVVVSLVFLGLFVWSCFYTVNFSFVVIALFLMHGAVMDNSSENYVSIFSPASKDYDLGVERKHVVVSKEMPLQRLLRFSGQNNLVTFEIEGCTPTVEFDESALKDMALDNKLSTPIYMAFQRKNTKKTSLENTSSKVKT